MRRGEVGWASLPPPAGSGPGFRRPVVVLQSDPFNRSRISTVVVAAVTTNLRLADAPGNVLLEQSVSGLPRDSTINVSQILTLDKSFLTERVSVLPGGLLARVESCLRLVLGLLTTHPTLHKSYRANQFRDVEFGRERITTALNANHLTSLPGTCLR